MLDELRLTSVGGIARAELSFGSGLTAVTGESGAGKSSLVRGLELVCGRRGSATIRRLQKLFFTSPVRSAASTMTFSRRTAHFR